MCFGLREALVEETGFSSKAAPRVRVVAVCGANDMKRYSSLKPQALSPFIRSQLCYIGR